MNKLRTLKLWWSDWQAGRQERTLKKVCGGIQYRLDHRMEGSQALDKPLEVARARTSFMGGYNMREGEKNGQTFCRQTLTDLCDCTRFKLIPPMKDNDVALMHIAK